MIRHDDKPQFEVVIPASTVAERRLVSVDRFAAMTGLSPTGGDLVALEELLDAVSADCARYCRLARAGTAPPTFGREFVRASWLKTNHRRGDQLALPWRVPVGTIAVSEAGIDLEGGSDYRLDGANVLQRIVAGAPACWSSDAIVVDWSAGWLVGVDASAYDGETDPVPADLVGRIVDQVRMGFLNRKTNPGLRSETFNDLWSGTYSVIGGDSIGESGLLRSLESALGPFRKVVVA